MTTHSIPTNGAVVEPMPMPLSAREFAERAAHIVRSMTGDPAHRAMDALVMAQLTSLGFGEGVAIFEQAVAGRHGRGHIEAGDIA